eukprot:scaffold556155_cov13-Prasinocladus_malaysianus.AAC.1
MTLATARPPACRKVPSAQRLAAEPVQHVQSKYRFGTPKLITQMLICGTEPSLTQDWDQQITQ